MYKITIFTLLLITIITFIIMMGCGGDSNTTSPNISTPTPDPSKTAYIKIKVQWPSRGEEGKYIISSKNGEELTASITKDTQGIKFYVYDNRDLNISPKPIIGTADIAYPKTSEIIRLDNAIVNPNDPNDFTNILPMIPVIVRAEAYQMVTFNPTPPDTYENLICAKEKEYTIQLGMNQISLNLGEYALTVNVSPSIIYPPADRSISTGYEDKNWSDSVRVGAITPPYTRTPGNPPTATPKPHSALITANLRLVCPPDTDQNGTPIPTTTPKPVAGKTIRFTVVSGDGVLDSYSAVTDENGNCSVNVSAGSVVKLSGTEDDVISLRADFQADPSDPNSTYTATCVVNVKYSYSLALSKATTDKTYINTPVPIKAVLKRIVDPSDPNSNIPVAGRTIYFKSDSTNVTKLLSASGTTDSNGECFTSAIARFCNLSAGITGTFTSNSYDPNSTVYTSSCDINCQRWKDDFNNYKSRWPEEQEFSINNWIKKYWKEYPDPPSDAELDTKNILDNGGLKLFAKACTKDPNGVVISGSTRTCAHRQLQLNKFTIKCKIKNGDEEGEYVYAGSRGCISISKIGMYAHPLIYFTRNNEIKLADSSIAVNYETNRWYYVEIDYSIGFINQDGSYYNNLYYRIYDSSHNRIAYCYIKRIGLSDWEIHDRPSAYLTLVSETGSVWFDDVEITSD